MLLIIASVIVGLLVPGSTVEGYEDYEDIYEEEKEDDYVNYDVVDEDDLALKPSIANEDEELKTNRIRRDRDEEEEVINTKNRDEDEEQEDANNKTRIEKEKFDVVNTKTDKDNDTNIFNTKAKLSPQEFAEFKGALSKLLSGMADENRFTPYSNTPSVDNQPSTELNTASTTPYDATAETSTESEELTNSSRVDEDTLTTILKLASEVYVHRQFPTRSSVTTNSTKSNADRLSSVKALEEMVLRQSVSADTTAKTARTPQIDIAKLLEIISELANEFESNLTRKLNESIAKMSIPTCTTPSEPTTTEVTVTDEYDANYTGAIIAKCFVCGLHERGIPQHAHCADAFAGDFLPLVPVDTSAKGKISSYRKYCKYANIRGFRPRAGEPRTLVGRWTGGCAVRWVDLSGVYTQRACRNRLQPSMGRHYASKRMAKLEKALWSLDNGCITSPVATLTPLSRGISLYARFHACVCTGNWCNAASVNAPLCWVLLFNLLSATRWVFSINS